MPLNRKNYLKKNNQILESNDMQKKDEDLFDKLLSSPMKQEVNFQPLSFWKNVVQTYGIRKSVKKNSLWLYESSDSDDSSFKSLYSDPSLIFLEPGSSDTNLTVHESLVESETSNTSVTSLNSDSSSVSSTKDVTLVTDKINEIRLSCATDCKDVLSETEISEQDVTNNIADLMETSLLLDSRLVTKRRKYNFSYSVVSSRASPSHMDHASWVHPNSFTRQSQYTDESFISDSKIFECTSLCYNESNISSLIRNRHVAIRRRHEFSRRLSEADTESQESFECSRVSTISSLNLIDDCSEMSSTVENQTEKNQNRESLFEVSLPSLDTKIALKPGKKWKRSMLILKHHGNNTLGDVSFQNSKIKGKKCKDFVESVTEMQSINSVMLHDTSISNASVYFKPSDESFTFESSVREAENTINNAEISKSSFDETFLEKTFLNRTVRVTQPEDAPSAFRTALGLEQSDFFVEDTFVGEITQVPNLSSNSAKDFVLSFCNQEDVLPFEEHFNERTMKGSKKIGEGVYGEVFLCSDTVIKVIPIEGSDLVNGERQKTFEEIISEVIIASKLSNLRSEKTHTTSAFCQMNRCLCVKGKYPQYLIKLWEEYDKMGRSENESPVVFKEDQLYIILELKNAGQDLESFYFQSPRQALSIFIQVAFGLAVAEKAFEFEHRDLHWGNILVSKVDEKFFSVILDDVHYEIPSKGVKACIIDFTLSRITHDGCSVYNDLSVDPALFAGEGDYQFDIYRMMLQEVQNEWSLFRPKNNLFWLHYVLDKMITMVYYKNKKAKTFNRQQENLKLLKSVVLKYNNSAEFVTSDFMKNFLK